MVDLEPVGRATVLAGWVALEVGGSELGPVAGVPGSWATSLPLVCPPCLGAGAAVAAVCEAVAAEAGACGHCQGGYHDQL